MALQMGHIHLLTSSPLPQQNLNSDNQRECSLIVKRNAKISLTNWDPSMNLTFGPKEKVITGNTKAHL